MNWIAFIIYTILVFVSFDLLQNYSEKTFSSKASFTFGWLCACLVIIFG